MATSAIVEQLDIVEQVGCGPNAGFLPGTVRQHAEENSRIGPSATVGAAWGAGCGPHLASGFQAIGKIAIVMSVWESSGGPSLNGSLFRPTSLFSYSKHVHARCDDEVRTPTHESALQP